ncbi:MAG: hypothetical protein SNH63_02265 [Rikenellaceae bacterium]
MNSSINYESPQIEVVEIEAENSILESSPRVGSVEDLQQGIVW